MNSRHFPIGCCLALLVACGGQQPDHRKEPEPPHVMLVAVGDIMMHSDVKKAAQDHGGFEPMWSEMEPLFRTADLVFGNLETPVAPVAGKPGQPYLFNAPADLPASLKRSGFTLLSTANNHSYDQGAKGLAETQTRLDAEGLVSIGSGPDRDAAEAPRILERNGIRIAFLGWTDLFNLNWNRPKGPWVNGLEEAKACEAVRAARRKADAVVVSIHWGKEDQHSPTPRQRDVAGRLFEAGADLILGHHPHVLQPLDILQQDGRRVAVAYSLGNFISNQNRTYRPERMSAAQGDERDGAAVVAIFTRRNPDRVELERVSYVPLWTENNWSDVKSGKTDQREIRVVRLDAPERQIQPWLCRRERIRDLLGVVRPR